MTTMILLGIPSVICIAILLAVKSLDMVKDTQDLPVRFRTAGVLVEGLEG